jgi:glycosyltransferase involved in cell wall biosynthesis
LRLIGTTVDAVAPAPALDAMGMDAVPDDLRVTVVRQVEELTRRQMWAAKARRPRGELSRGSFDAQFRAVAAGADVLHLEETQTGWCGLGMPVPRVLNVHYLAYRNVSVETLTPRDVPRVAEFLYAEALLARRHRWLVASSDYVAGGLRRLAPRSEVVVIPLSLDPAHYRPAVIDGPPRVGIIGTMTWAPTRAAVEHLMNRVWPLVVGEVPEAELHVAGIGADTLSSAAQHAGVRIVGRVASANDFLRSLTVLAYPAPARGSGMKVKVMEAMATGVPVVTTRRGAEGIGPSDGVVVMSDEQSLARMVVDLLRDLEACRQRGASGRNDMVARFSPRVTASAFDDVYAAVAGTG